MTTSIETMQQLILKMKKDFEGLAPGSLQDNRRSFDEAGLKAILPEGIRIEAVQLSPNVSADWIIPATLATNPEKIILYFHGGGYSIGSSTACRPLCARIAHRAQCKVFSVNYRLAPEHKYPAALDDALLSYAWLLQNHPDKKIVIAGDSAGGGLAMATLLALKQRHLPMPAGTIGISAWLDLECTSQSYAAYKHIDLLASAEGLRFVGRAYANKTINKDPLISPFYAKDLHGLCPLLMQIGSAETLLDENVAFAKLARKDGVAVELQIWPNMVHVWHSLYGLVPEAEQAIEAIAQWIGRGDSI